MNNYEAEKLFKKILYFSIEERERCLDIFKSHYAYNITNLLEMCKSNNGDEILKTIMNKNQEWIVYNIKLVELELFKVKRKLIDSKPYKDIIEDDNSIKRIEEMITKELNWFNQKLNYIYETRYSSKPCYFNEVEESKLFDDETKRLTINTSSILEEMLRSLEKIISIINRGHCYFHELFLVIERIETASPIIDDYLKIYNNYREDYFKELNSSFNRFKSDLRVYYPNSY